MWASAKLYDAIASRTAARRRRFEEIRVQSMSFRAAFKDAARSGRGDHESLSSSRVSGGRGQGDVGRGHGLDARRRSRLGVAARGRGCQVAVVRRDGAAGDLDAETPIERFLPTLVERLKSGTELRRLVSAAALANARAFGGQDYDGYHAFMALAPAYQMAAEMPEAKRRCPS